MKRKGNNDVVVYCSCDEESQARVLLTHGMASLREADEVSGRKTRAGIKRPAATPKDCTAGRERANVRGVTEKPRRPPILPGPLPPYSSVLDYGRMADQAKDYLKEAPEYMRGALGEFIAKLREAAGAVFDKDSDKYFLKEAMKSLDKVEDTIPPKGGIAWVFGEWSQSMVDAYDVLHNGYDPDKSEWLTNRPRGRTP